VIDELGREVWDRGRRWTRVNGPEHRIEVDPPLVPLALEVPCPRCSRGGDQRLERHPRNPPTDEGSDANFRGLASMIPVLEEAREQIPSG